MAAEVSGFCSKILNLLHLLSAFKLGNIQPRASFYSEENSAREGRPLADGLFNLAAAQTWGKLSPGKLGPRKLRPEQFGPNSPGPICPEPICTVPNFPRNISFIYSIYSISNLYFSSISSTFLLFLQFLDAIAYPGTYPCRSVSQRVGQWVMFSTFGDSYRIYRACELVSISSSSSSYSSQS